MRALAIAAAVLLCSAGIALADAKKTSSINALRSDAGLPALRYSAQLEEAARAHADDMLRARIFAHQGSDGSDVGQRVSRTGYGWCVVAENIAQGQRDLAEVMAAWAASPGHRANMVSRDVTEFAVVEGGGYIWVMVLARPGC